MTAAQHPIHGSSIFTFYAAKTLPLLASLVCAFQQGTEVTEGR